MRLRGFSIGREHVRKGVNVVLGPMMNMGRQAQGGRNWEGFGADPFLSGESAYETVLGLQVCHNLSLEDRSEPAPWVICLGCWSASLREALH